MALTRSFGVLSDIIEQYEPRGMSVRNLEVSQTDGGRLRASMEIPVPICDQGTDLAPESATLTDDGRLRVEFAPPDLFALPATDAATVASEEIRITDSGGIVLQVQLTIDPDDGSRQPAAAEESQSAEDRAATNGQTQTGDETPASGPSATPGEQSSGDSGTRGGSAGRSQAAGSEVDSTPETPDLTTVRDETVPPYEDTAYLDRLYSVCDTFAEMSRVIEMDVSSETVRRYMIEAGIHEPDSYETASDDSPADSVDAQAETEDPLAGIPDEHVVTDGGLPADLTLPDVAEAVVDSRCVYDVSYRLDLEQERTRELLDRFDLLDLVMHRMSGPSSPKTSYRAVASRIRQCTQA